MAKKVNPSSSGQVPQKPAQPAARPVAAAKPKAAVAEAPYKEIEVKDPKLPAWLYEFKVQAIIVGLLAFALYVNSTSNEYALDDTIQIVKNEYVWEGFAGLPDIMTKDAFDSYYKQFNSSNQLSGGRYRPLSQVSYAIEQQFFGAIPKDKMDSFRTHPNGINPGFSYGMKQPFERKFLSDMHVRHFFNVLWFTACVVVLLYFLRYIVFRSNTLLALLTTILFVIHPIHTEVVANVKSRDEIMSLLFICLTFIYAFKYEEHKKKWMMVAGCVSYFLAFLAKEYAIGLIVLLPLAFMLFNRYSFGKSLKASLPFFAVMAVYIAMRLNIVASMNKDSDADILNNPYAKVTDEAMKKATQISTILNYIKLLIWPQHLSSDYSYDTISYKTFAHPMVWASMLIHGTLIWLMFSFFRKAVTVAPKGGAAKSENRFSNETYRVMCFAISTYILYLALVCNLIFNIGGTMGERLIFHSSLGFCMAVAYLMWKGAEMIKPAVTGKVALGALTLALVGLCGFKTIERNKDWKNDDTLFNHDIAEAPNSVLVNANVASSLINKAEEEPDTVKKRDELHRGLVYYHKATTIHNTFVSGYMNTFVAYLKLNEPDSAKMNLDLVKMYYPNYPKLEEIYYNLGVCYYMQKKIPQAIQQWQTSLKLKPSYIIAAQSINTATQAMQAQAQGQDVKVK